MVRALTRLSDRVLDKVLPTAKARAEACWWTETGIHCCVYAGRTYCG